MWTGWIDPTHFLLMNKFMFNAYSLLMHFNIEAMCKNILLGYYYYFHICIISNYPIMYRSVYIVYTVLGDVSIFVVGKDEYDELACK